MYCSTFVVQAILLELCAAGYVLETSYTSANWFDQFSFFTSGDPTAGYVNYVDQSTATNNGYINTSNGLVYMGVDSTNVATGSGRDSVRITSNAAYNYGLFALDVSHMPGGICGTWPAFWMVGPNWPNDGEIDIIEGVNDNANNAMTLHTSDGCSITDGTFTGTLTTSNCYVYAPDQSNNAGCDIQNQNTQSYGNNFNSNGGGVIAMEWTSSDINIWFFPRGTTPSDLEAGTPDPASWKEPVAQYQGDCDIPNHFADMQIVFNTDFCGDWAGAVWGTSSYCSSLADTCNDYVQNNPSAFANAFWLINSLDVYQSDGDVVAVSHVAVSPAGHQRNETAPLLSTPLAMGGGLPNPPGKRAMRRGRSMMGGNGIK
ncbi:hypothetical protein HO173_010038 [Letharia columbiana]|uniref:endo-1,3(4)-beta-glucanase n=1 Tax=Letharia columbiana TaxID=112416 RepID=A0A8H6L180_9LECA|nr:uncharacterized protein HO173_010038 [Letharia columbiana]KAF6231736.1 hypothetical protein HO173_010038 [Letharia columbiana]